MELGKRYASNVKGNTGVALVATCLGVTALDTIGGGWLNANRGSCCCSDDQCGNRCPTCGKFR